MWIANLLVILTTVFPSTSKVAEAICLSSEEKTLFKAINQYRKEKKLPVISLSEKLTKVAQTHAKDLSEYYGFDMNNKCNPHSWSKKGDWTWCCYTNDHKQAQCMWDKPREIAGYEGDGYEIAYYHSAGAKAQNALTGWQKSKGHNPLLINLGIWKDIEWKGIGIGIYENYATVWFGRIDDNSELVICKE